MHYHTQKNAVSISEVHISIQFLLKTVYKNLVIIKNIGPIGQKTAKNGDLYAAFCQKTLFTVEKSFTDQIP